MTSPDRWSCPTCDGTLVRPPGITDARWDWTRTARQRVHARRHQQVLTQPGEAR